MRISRIFQPTCLTLHAHLALDEKASHHVARVLRHKMGDSIVLFNGNGGEYLSEITKIDKKQVFVQLHEYHSVDRESDLELYLAQGISRGEKMDYTIQKAVELGVKKIIPLFTERCTVKLDTQRQKKRLEHWQSIIIAACEQSGRNTIPTITPPQSLENALASFRGDVGFVLSPHSIKKLSELTVKLDQRIILLIGPEGGLTDQEMNCALSHHFLPLNLGPRVLRTETAAVAAITALQCYFGDMK